MAYTDETEMPFGKFKGKRLIDVPANYLLWWYDQPASDKYKKNADLVAYIEDNKKVLELQKRSEK